MEELEGGQKGAGMGFPVGYFVVSERHRAQCTSGVSHSVSAACTEARRQPSVIMRPEKRCPWHPQRICLFIQGYAFLIIKVSIDLDLISIIMGLCVLFFFTDVN